MANNGAGSTSRPDTRKALLGAITGLLAVLTAIGTVNGTVAEMIRNHPAATITALVLAALAVLCGLLAQVGWGGLADKALVTVGSMAFVAGTVFAIVAQVRTYSFSDRPRISTTTEISGHDVVLKVHVEDNGAEARDQVVVTVWGRDQNNRRTPSMYYSKTGPDDNGRLVQDVQIETHIGAYRGVYLTALIVSEHQRPPEVDCDGDIVMDDGTNLRASGTNMNVSFRPSGNNPDVGCAVVDFPTTP